MSTRILGKDRYTFKPHVYRSIYTWWKSVKLDSYKVKLRKLEYFATLEFEPAEIDFINSLIDDIKTNHADCL